MRVTVFALHRSGTNWAEQILKRSIKDVKVVNIDRQYIWKHSYDIDLSRVDDLGVHVYLIKNPYTWVESVTTRNKADILKRYGEVIKAGQSSKDHIAGFDIEGLGKLWRDHALWWHREDVVEAFKYIKFRYEDLLLTDGPTKLVDEVCARYDLQKIGKHADVPNKVSQSQPWTKEMTEMYTSVHLKQMSWEQVQLINGVIPDEAWKLGGTSASVPRRNGSTTKYK